MIMLMIKENPVKVISASEVYTHAALDALSTFGVGDPWSVHV